MNKLEDFDTLAEAQAYEVTTYNKITSGQASQYFGLTGMLDALEENADSKTPLELEPDIFTTVGALCRTVLASANGTGFACDPNTYDGVVNRGAAQLLLAAGVFTSQAIVDKFWEKGATVTKPFENATQADFARAKGLMTYSNEIQQTKGFIKLTVSADCEAHRPKIFAVVQDIKTQIGTAPEISISGDYLARVPTNHASYVVENFYGVIS